VSFYDSILSNTVGVAFRAYTGNVDPWTLQNQKDNAAAAAVQALGPDATPEQIAAAQSQVESEIDTTLTMQGAHPDQASLGPRLPIIGVLDLPKIQKLVDGVLITAAVGAVIYFGVLYHKTIRRELDKLREGR
jgi:hypothetical protein